MDSKASEATTTAEERRVWTEDQMHRCASPPTDLLPPLLLPITNELGMPTPQPPLGGQIPSDGVVKQKHSHYYKDVANLDFIDVYRVLQLFNVTDPCIQHAVKKLLVAGGRGAGKDITKDVHEAMDSLARFLEMRDEETVDLLK